ncbi:Uncharacterized vancomycin resistance protein-like protein [Desulforamulus reducens MI-1]|uniref:Uncharacterized vancomycin resistance protein-like protein n=1 Tax=Desulforamulus reducens (strain ATCC BAA-1160 / DSM 100696 / MI-1) TaxID=349161 RepID=A4J346_DESRM|nr:Uncharacterized vancomycin resistance protein-like protein [Desulforamulus reducens MI-1]
MAVGFFARPWILWGAFYYATAGILTLTFRKNFSVAAFLSTGTIFHMTLTYYVYQAEKSICPSCLLFLIAGLILTLMYVFKDFSRWDPKFLPGAGLGLLIVSVILLTLGYNNTGAQSQPAFAETKKTQPEETITITVNKPSSETSKKQETIPGEPEPLSFGSQVEVKTKHGEALKIDLNKKTALLVAWWCPHCDYALKNISKYYSNDRPYIVFCYNDGDQRDFIEKKLKSANLTDAEYYILEGDPPVDGVPTMVWWEKGKLKQGRAFEVSSSVQKLIGRAEIRIGKGNGAINAALSGEAINGKEIPPGGVFSFNETVGERTVERGYVAARQIISTPEGYDYADGIGGGICRTSTVLHKAVMAAGLLEVEHHSHSLPVDYEEDTAVAWGGWDYKFRNILSVPVTIKCQKINENLVVELWQN